MGLGWVVLDQLPQELVSGHWVFFFFQTVWSVIDPKPSPEWIPAIWCFGSDCQQHKPPFLWFPCQFKGRVQVSCASSAEDSPVVATRWQLLQKHQTEGLVVFALIWASEKNTLGSLGCQRLSAQPQAGNLKLFVSEFNTHMSCSASLVIRATSKIMKCLDTLEICVIVLP